MTTRLIVDMHYLCWRAYYTTGQLSFNEAPTGVLFGVLRELLSLSDRFNPDQFVFCFEGKDLHRKKDFPEYKSNRKKMKTEQEKKDYQNVLKQIALLREVIIQDLGFQNIFSVDGFEADDLIAATIIQWDEWLDVHPDNEIVIVSSDHDLYQLLQEKVMLWMAGKKDKKLYRYETFLEEFGIRPVDWILVKAIAGCSGDGIPGVAGVGEVTACKYIKRQLPRTSKNYANIKSNLDLIHRNLKLVRLPYTHIELPTTIEHIPISPKIWDPILERLGFKSIRNLMYDQELKKTTTTQRKR